MNRWKSAFGLLFVAGLAVQAAAPVPRPAPEFKIQEPSGKATLLSAQKGKVCVIQFLFTWCQHCQATAQSLSKLQTELGGKGLRVFGVGFNDEVLAKAPDATNTVAAFSQYAVGRHRQEGDHPRPDAAASWCRQHRRGQGHARTGDQAAGGIGSTAAMDSRS
jgi:thiol-disulfide isomerase/thioredoxin